MKQATLLLMAISMSSANLAVANHFNLQLAQIINLNELGSLHPADYVYSEKLDGVRGYWDGSQLYTRQGNRIHAPESFLTQLPDFPVEGELWIERGSFAKVSGITRSKAVSEEAWNSIKFYIFDLPHHPAVFSERRQRLERWHANHGNHSIKLISIYELQSSEELAEAMHKVQKAGGEGLMLHRKDAVYSTARSFDLLKLKGFQDAEARVIGYTSGKGKYAGKVGALIVENNQGHQFKIGSGLTDAQRASPPQTGSIVTYRFNGYTAHGKPRFARFDRVRKDFE